MQKGPPQVRRKRTGGVGSCDMTEANSKMAAVETVGSVLESKKDSLNGDDDVMEAYKIRKIQTVEKHLSRCINIEMLTN